MKKCYIKYLPVLLIVVFIQPTIAQNTYKKLSVAQSDSLIKANDTNPNFVILDVRTKYAWENEHLEGSICRNFFDSDFEDQLNALPKHKTFLVYCAAGSRSVQAFQKMQDLDFAEVYDMQGGINTWKNGGYPTTTVIEPKLMLVNYEEISSEENGSGTDTISFTVTNRANGLLSFTSASFNDKHDVSASFNNETELEGAEDYTFYIYHSPGYIETDTTTINIESNGGQLELEIIIKNGIIQSADEVQLQELLIYPNPANQVVTIKTSDGQPADKISLVNLSGQVLLSTVNQSILQISDIDEGFYILLIEHKGIPESKKLLIKR